MTHFLATPENPEGYKIEALILSLRADLIRRMSKILGDSRPEARTILANDIKILNHLTASIEIAEENTRILDRAFGPHRPGRPRIGEP